MKPFAGPEDNVAVIEKAPTCDGVYRTVAVCAVAKENAGPDVTVPFVGSPGAIPNMEFTSGVSAGQSTTEITIGDSTFRAKATEAAFDVRDAA